MVDTSDKIILDSLGPQDPFGANTTMTLLQNGLGNASHRIQYARILISSYDQRVGDLQNIERPKIIQNFLEPAVTTLVLAAALAKDDPDLSLGIAIRENDLLREHTHPETNGRFSRMFEQECPLDRYLQSRNVLVGKRPDAVTLPFDVARILDAEFRLTPTYQIGVLFQQNEMSSDDIDLKQFLDNKKRAETVIADRLDKINLI